MRVIVVGAGLAGLTTAYLLQREGIEVTVLEAEAGPGLGTSFANGAMLHPSICAPWNAPGLLWQVLRWLGREDAPLLLRPRSLPSLAGWGIEFLRQSSPARFAENSDRNLRLALLSLREMASIRASTPLAYAYQGRGLLSVFRSEAARAARLLETERLSAQGLPLRVLDRASLLALEPALEPIGEDLVGGIHYQADEGGDAHLFCAELARVLAEGGATLRYGQRVEKLIVAGGRLEGVRIAGETLSAERCVLAAASDSVALAHSAGLRLPVRPVKGYSITMPRSAAAEAAPQVGIEDGELHAVVVPVGESHVRVAGTAELAGYDLAINQHRIDNLRGLLARLFPRFAAALGPADVRPWAGLRPMCADGVPLLGTSGVGGLYLNTGHGHLGWTLAAGSARLVTDSIVGRAGPLLAEDYTLARFGR